MGKGNPIFVRGLSRSGGTLLATILDAHPEIAMSYELYPHLLVRTDGNVPGVDWLIDRFRRAKNLAKAGSKIKDRNIRVFVLRCMRGGLDNEEMIGLLEEHQNAGLDFGSIEGRLTFIQRCCLEKMKHKGKSLWGAKCTGAYKDYLSVFPQARFLNIIRDGRDVLASQLNTGDFKKTPSELGESWSRNHMKFRNLVNRKDVAAYEVVYESWCRNPKRNSEISVTFSSACIPTRCSIFISRILPFISQTPGIYLPIEYQNRSIHR